MAMGGFCCPTCWDRNCSCSSEDSSFMSRKDDTASVEPDNKAKLKEIRSDLYLILNLNAVESDEDTVADTKDENWKMLKAVIDKLAKIIE